MTKRLVVLDTETTGMKAEEGHRVIEIGMVEILGRRLGRAAQHYLNPERDIEAGAFAVHGLSRQFLEDKPRFHEIAKDFLDFMDGAELIMHNAEFDKKFLDAELARASLPPLAHHCAKVVDSLKVARNLFPGQRNSLDALCARLGVDASRRSLHGALLDATLLAKVWLAMTRGQEDFFSKDEGFSLLLPRKPKEKPLVLRASDDERQAHEIFLASLSQEGESVSW